MFYEIIKGVVKHFCIEGVVYVVKFFWREYILKPAEESRSARALPSGGRQPQLPPASASYGASYSPPIEYTPLPVTPPIYPFYERGNVREVVRVHLRDVVEAEDAITVPVPTFSGETLWREMNFKHVPVSGTKFHIEHGVDSYYHLDVILVLLPPKFRPGQDRYVIAPVDTSLHYSGGDIEVEVAMPDGERRSGAVILPPRLDKGKVLFIKRTSQERGDLYVVPHFG